METSEKSQRYLVEGNLPLGLWRFAAPFMAAHLLQALYGAVDVLIVGRFCDAAALSAVSTGAQLLWTLTGLILGLAGGATALVAFMIGARNAEGTARAIGTASTLFALVALVVTPLVAFNVDWFTRALQTPAEAVTGTRVYMLTVALGLPFITGYNVVGAIYRGFGDSVTPTIFVVVSCVANVVGDLALVGYYKLGPFGAALATDLALMLSFFCALAYMRVKRFPFEFHRRHFKLDWPSVKKILGVGAPLALQDAFTSFSFLIIFAIVNMMGVMQSAGMGVADRVIGFLFLPPIAFANAVTTATAQNYGARKEQRAFKACLWGMGFSLFFGLVFWALCQIFPTEIAAIFTNDEEVALHGGRYLRSFALDCICVAFIFNVNGYFCGLGRAMVVFAHSVVATLFGRIPLSYLFSRKPGATLYDVGFAAPLASCVSIVVCLGYLLWLRRLSGKGKLHDHDVDATQDS